MNLEQFRQALEQGGAWCIADPYILFKREEEGLPGDCLVQKYLLRHDKIIVVTLRQLDNRKSKRIGIEVFPRQGVEFSEEQGKVRIKRDYIAYETLLAGEKYYEYAGVFLEKYKGSTIRHRRYRLNQQFLPDLLATGYVTEEEFFHYSQDENLEQLPVVELMDLHLYLPKKECAPDICSWCQCRKEEHKAYWPCPLLGGRLLCDLCCHYDSRSDDPFLKVPEIVEVARYLTGKALTVQDCIAICKQCGEGGLGHYEE